jgi:hypothetical protein
VEVEDSLSISSLSWVQSIRRRLVVHLNCVCRGGMLTVSVKRRGIWMG